MVSNKRRRLQRRWKFPPSCQIAYRKKCIEYNVLSISRKVEHRGRFTIIDLPPGSPSLVTLDESDNPSTVSLELI